MNNGGHSFNLHFSFQSKISILKTDDYLKEMWCFLL